MAATGLKNRLPGVGRFDLLHALGRCQESNLHEPWFLSRGIEAAALRAVALIAVG
ncbi:hypothetical protein [Streptomyces tubercidicus]|uniref:hypothetical protein n=1 Tax=Streptomyces tubercidicus TaxID=47759 RepID=UPI00399C0C9F